MGVPRRQFLRWATSAAALSALPRGASALGYPARPVRIVVGYAAGSAPDIAARIIGQWLSERFGQQFVVENRPGAGTNLSTETVVRAAPDGYTLLLIATPNMISGLLRQNLSFNFLRDIAPVGSVGGTPFVMVVSPSFPAKTVPEFIAYAKAHPGQINMASNGTGNLTHITGELFKMMSGVDLVHVPYHGEVEAQADLLSGRAQVIFNPIISAIGAIKAGTLRALAVTTAKRVDVLPGVPAIAEFVPGYEVEGWLGIGAPSATPPEIIDKLNREINSGIDDAGVRTHLVDLGNVPTKMSPAEYGKLIADENEKWGKVIKFAGIKLD
jgi:tripartite-type tricarboxylate transporter receptor subunit TctC